MSQTITRLREEHTTRPAGLLSSTNRTATTTRRLPVPATSSPGWSTITRMNTRGLVEALAEAIAMLHLARIIKKRKNLKKNLRKDLNKNLKKNLRKNLKKNLRKNLKKNLKNNLKKRMTTRSTSQRRASMVRARGVEAIALSIRRLEANVSWES